MPDDGPFQRADDWQGTGFHRAFPPPSQGGPQSGCAAPRAARPMRATQWPQSAFCKELRDTRSEWLLALEGSLRATATPLP